MTTVLGPDTDSLWVAPPNTTVVKLTISNTVMSGVLSICQTPYLDPEIIITCVVELDISEQVT